MSIGSDTSLAGPWPMPYSSAERGQRRIRQHHELARHQLRLHADQVTLALVVEREDLIARRLGLLGALDLRSEGLGRLEHAISERRADDERSREGANSLPGVNWIRMVVESSGQRESFPSWRPSAASAWAA